jgi:hypothetical protein
MLPLGLLLWPALDLAIACLAASSHGRWRRLIHPWIGHRLISVVICLPLAVALTSEIRARAGNYWYGPPSGRELLSSIRIALFFSFQGDPDNFAGLRTETFLVVLLLAVAVLGTLKLRQRKGAFAVAIASSLVPLVTLGLITLHTPIWIPRYLLIATPAFTLVLAAGLAVAWHWWVGRVMAAGILVLTFLQLLDLQDSSRRADWRPLVAAVSRAGTKVILVTLHIPQWEIEFEWHRQGLPGEPLFADISMFGDPQPHITYWIIKLGRKKYSNIAAKFGPNRFSCSFGAPRTGVFIFPALDPRGDQQQDCNTADR